MISTRVTKDKGNLAVVECNCKVDGIERWLRNRNFETSLLFPRMIAIKRSSKEDLT